MPVVAAQALTLRYELGYEISPQEVSNQDAASVLVEDVDGYPIAYLTVLGPDAHGDFWEAINNATQSANKHYLVSTGASTLYPPHQFADATKGTISDLQDTLAALGGRVNLARVVSFGTPGQLYLQDIHGQYWDVDTSRTIPDSNVAELISSFRSRIGNVALSDDYIENMQLLWRCLLGKASESECSPNAADGQAEEIELVQNELFSSLGYDVTGLNSQDFANPAEPGFSLWDMQGGDGELDFNKAQNMVLAGGYANYDDTKGPSNQSSTHKAIGWWGWGHEYTLKAVRSTGVVNYSFIGQNWQRYWQLGFPDRQPDADFDNFTLFEAGPGAAGQVGGHPVGCGPAAFLRLATWYNFERHQYTGSPNIEWFGYTPNVSWNDTFEERMHDRTKWMAQRLLELQRYTTYPDGTGNYKVYYRPLLAEYMGTHAFMNNGLTTAGAFYAGANRWLSSVGSSMRLRGGGYLFIANLVPAVGWAFWNNEVWKMYSALMHSIGVRNEPAIALYPVPGTSHYRPVLEARVINWHVNAEVFITAPPEWTGDAGGASGKEISISGFFNLVGGAYELR